MMKLLNNFIILLQNDGGKEMMAMLWAQEIMSCETTEDAKAMYLIRGRVKEPLMRLNVIWIHWNFIAESMSKQMMKN